METGSGVIEELRGDVREVVRLSRVPRGLQHRRGSGCGSGANLQNPFCAAQGGNLRGIAIQTGAGGVVAIQRVGNAMLLVEQQFQRRTLPGEEGVVPGDAGFQILRQRLAPLALRRGTLPEAQAFLLSGMRQRQLSPSRMSLSFRQTL